MTVALAAVTVATGEAAAAAALLQRRFNQQVFKRYFHLIIKG